MLFNYFQKMIVADKFFGPIIFFILLCGFPQIAKAISPMNSFNDLVAGEGAAGFKDGLFYSALFHSPKGMALNSDGSILYVTDQENHCIRMIDLKHSNSVSTLTGTGKPGFADGSLSLAAFNSPNALVYLPGDHLAVGDNGNFRIRLIDLKSKTVSTLVGTGVSGLTDGPSEKARVGNIWNMVFLPGRDVLCFSQDGKALRALDLKTNQLATLLNESKEIPSPSTLCTQNEKLYVADNSLGQIFELSFSGPVSNASPPSFVCRPFTKANGVLGMAWSGASLYGVQIGSDGPLARLAPSYQPMTFVSIWGETLPGPDIFGYGLNYGTFQPVAILADPFSTDRFYLCHPEENILTAFRALDTQGFPSNDYTNKNGLKDFSYPQVKPAKTFRILMIGDSHISYVSDDPEAMPKGALDGSLNLHFKDLSKILELDLNSLAALEDVPRRFEVLRYWRNSGDGGGLTLWPYYEVPEIVQKFDVDLVIYIFHSSGIYPGLYYQRPLDPNGVPSREMDMDYFLKPARERIAPGLPKELFDLSVAQKNVTITDNNQIVFNSYEVLARDKRTLECAARMCARPIELMFEKLASFKTREGEKVRTLTVFVPLPHLVVEERKIKPLVDEVLKEFHSPYIDLSPEMNAYHISYNLFTEMGGGDHFTSDGHALLGFWLTYELIHRKAMPFDPAK